MITIALQYPFANSRPLATVGIWMRARRIFSMLEVWIGSTVHGITFAGTETSLRLTGNNRKSFSASLTGFHQTGNLRTGVTSHRTKAGMRASRFK